MLIHTADLHIGAFSRSPLSSASLYALERIAEYVLTEGAEVLVIAGDLFETPRLENYEHITRVARTFRRLAGEGVPIVAVPGSHDSSLRGRSLLDVFREAGLVNVPGFRLDQKGLTLHPLRVKSYVFYGLPGLRNSLEQTYLSEGKVFFEDTRDGGPRILVAHTSVKFAGYDPSTYAHRYGKISMGGNEILGRLPQIDYVALGHVHIPLPVSRRFTGNIAYPGAPVGRDANDVWETLALRKRGFNRRILAVEPGSGHAEVRSILDDFGVDVGVVRSGYTEPDELLREAEAVLKDLGADYKCLIVSLENVPPDKRPEVEKLFARLAAERGVWIHLRTRLAEPGRLTLDLRDELASIEELEAEAVRQAVEKLGLRIDPPRLLNLLNILGRERSPDVSKTVYVEQVVGDAMKVLEEMFRGEK